MSNGQRSHFRLLTDKELHVLILRHHGLLQTSIAAHLGITQGAVSRFETSARKKIAEAQRQLALLGRLGLNQPDEIGRCRRENKRR